MTNPRTQVEVADLEFRMERELAESVACPRCGARRRIEGQRKADLCCNTGRGTALHGPAHWQRIKKAGGGAVAATAEAWDTHWYRIWEDCVNDGMEEQAAKAVAEKETTEQFGRRPEVSR